MRQPFYSWLMTKRHSKSTDAAAVLAALIFEESHFPKQTSDFDQVSRFLEEEASFMFNLSDFDRIWEDYLLDAS